MSNQVLVLVDFAILRPETYFPVMLVHTPDFVTLQKQKTSREVTSPNVDFPEKIRPMSGKITNVLYLTEYHFFFFDFLSILHLRLNFPKLHNEIPNEMKPLF